MYNQPDNDFDLPIYLTSVETISELQHVPVDSQARLLIPYLNTKTTALICCRLPVDQITTYDGLKIALLQEFRLAPQLYCT